MPSDHIVLAAMEKIGHKEALEKGDSAKKTQRSVKSLISSTLRHIFILYIVPQFRVRTLVTVFLWFAANIVYYGIALNATNLSTDPYLYIFLGGLLEIPAYLLLWPALIFIGRKKSLVALFLVCGISIILVMMLLLFPTGAEGVVVFLSQLGKMAVTAAFELVWMYTTELFPTQYRSLAIGEANIIGKMGATCSPYINDILGQHTVWAPSALFGLVSLLAAALTLLLPETRHCDMPELSDFFKKDEGVTDAAMKDVSQGVANASFVSDTSRMEQSQTSTAK